MFKKKLLKVIIYKFEICKDKINESLIDFNCWENLFYIYIYINNKF